MIDELSIDDPLSLQELLWPQWPFYAKQEEVVYALRDVTDSGGEVYVPAGNKLGKDFITGFICPTFFLFPQCYFSAEYVRYIESLRCPEIPNPHTVRIITTSVKDDHLRVLWGEIGRFVQSSQYLLEYPDGPLVLNHRDIRKMVGPEGRKQECKISYLRGMVSERGEGLAGHHAAYTLFVGDEASGMDNIAYEMAQGWAKKFLFIGNPNDCENFWKDAVEGGDILVEA